MATRKTAHKRPAQRGTDLLIVDGCGPGFTPECFDRPMGGSELEEVLIAEALAADGVSVVIQSQGLEPLTRHGVNYRPPGTGLLPSKALWVQRTTHVHWSEFHGPIVLRPTDLGWDNYDWDLLADKRCTLVTVSDWQRSTFDRKKPIANDSITIPPPMLPIKRRRTHRVGAQRWVYTSHFGKGWAATVEVWKHLKRDGVLPENYSLAGLFPWGELPPFEVDWANYVIEMPRHVTAAEMRDFYEHEETGALFNVNTFAETRGVAPAWAVYAGLPVHILAKSGRAGLAESIVGPGLTEEWPEFVAGIKAHVRGTPAIHPGRLPDLSAKAMVKKWAKVLGL